MFDLIDNLVGDVWEDKGSPPDALETIDDFTSYKNCQIFVRKPNEEKKEIMYGVTNIDDSSEKLNVILRGAKVKDPLKNVRHFYAKLVKIDSDKEEDVLYEVQTILLDMDWCVKK